MSTDEKPPDAARLETLGDVQRALARLAYRIDRRKMNLDKARELRQTLVALAALMQDKRDSRYQKRLKALWEAYQKEQGNAPETTSPEH